ncbi:class I SAM-dependent methyltransferase [Limnofasciculus baicalensis]|uniref:Methyltransferase domain-containing protein n=1 Tax=Limnofasciculus baicalensis BBK-W-15 TaxID=2699891 RepID=A0AAE3GQG9_9CYAN|nr:methyltransferase domain-containing protein [Limnofasciculus baicalensis]MCP2728304.1 methyltransferase domain-containing protein [Limnofasciculus baicalensis BBK-W-15]
MLAPKIISNKFTDWNQKHKAPFGSEWWYKFVNSKNRGSNFAWRNRFKIPYLLMQQIGAFGFQHNSQTRIFEYPWCFFATPLEAGMRVLEVGAGASGFQFILAEHGLEVTSVDPLINPSEKVDWLFTSHQFNYLNQAFRGKVNFIQDFLQNAQIESNTYDRVFSISAIEHIPPEEVAPLVKEIARILKPGGFFIATIDLFLDCYPFTAKISNRYGSNISICSLIEASGLRIKVGNPCELYGYPEFKPENIHQQLDEFLVVKDPWEKCLILTQCIILEKVT